MAYSLAWIPQRKELLLSSAIEFGNASEFRILDLARGGQRPASFQTRYSESIALSRSGQVAYTQISADKNIWKLELDESGKAIGAPIHLLSPRDMT